MSKKYVRKTEDVYEIRGNYGCGFECVCASTNRKEALSDLKAHQANEPAYAFKMVKTRVKKEEV